MPGGGVLASVPAVADVPSPQLIVAELMWQLVFATRPLNAWPSFAEMFTPETSAAARQMTAAVSSRAPEQP